MGAKKEKQQREGYRVGLFKNGQLKKLLNLKEGVPYLRSKFQKMKKTGDNGTITSIKRTCTPAQLEALARGRAARAAASASKRDGSGSGGGSRKGPPKPRAKDIHLYREGKVQTKRRKNKQRMRREKEMASGRHRGGEDEYNSSGVDEDGISDSAGSDTDNSD